MNSLRYWVERIIDTIDLAAEAIKIKENDQYELRGRSIVVLLAKPPGQTESPALVAAQGQAR